jgi:hypothetical protein
MKTALETKAKMQNCLDRLGIPLKIMWIPKADRDKHGEINGKALFIYDEDDREAWVTLEHEIYEFKFKEVTYAYRTLVNSLIEGFEKLAYERKEKFLESLSGILEIIAEQREDTSNSG